MTGVAPDGSPVELYVRLGPLGEPELVHAAAPPGAEILELGCGAGRVTHALLALGHGVVAVDNAPEMLAHVQAAETVLSDVEDLELGRRFDVVLLASNFVNTPDREQRRRLLETCARHVSAEGAVLIERMPADWVPPREPSVLGDVVIAATEVRRSGRLVEAVMEYRIDGTVWRQPFVSYLIDDDELEAVLGEVGLRVDRYLDERHSWLRAVRAPRGRS